MTTNSNWTECKNFRYKGQTSFDRPDGHPRVFRIKNMLLRENLLRLTKIFGSKAVAIMHANENQKRGDIHGHTLACLENKLT